MRKILLYEHLTATADVVSPLYREGKAMLDAVATDLRAVPGVEVAIWQAHANCGLEAAARSCDGVLLIAPETGGVLGQLCRLVENAAGVLLGPSSEAVAATADKFRLAERLAAASVPTPPCGPAGPNDWPYPQVCKPRDGAGSQATFLVNAATDWPRCLQQARHEGFAGELIAQRYVSGIAASVSLLIGHSEVLPLTPTRQILSNDGRFKYLESRATLPTAMTDTAIELGRRAVAAVPGLRGYVGVDLVLAEPSTGIASQVIEINPRLTSSYLLLRTLSPRNLMEVMLQLLTASPAIADTRPDRSAQISHDLPSATGNTRREH
jgi:predicted ATP-grasp superfamily ATP-dependent carboligase